jgi:cyanate lyase
MNREDVTDLIIQAKVRKGIKWADVATKVGLSKEWVTAACLGQMTLSEAQAATLGDTLICPLRHACGCRKCLTKAHCPPACPPTR